MTTPTTVQVRLQIRADTAANWTSVNPVLLANELGLESDTKKFKIGNGSSTWGSLAYFPSIVSGGTVLGNLEIGTTGTLTFEGSTADGFETTLGVVDPTADRTILLPNQSGTVVVGGNASITNADIAANAEIAVSKLADGAARQLLQTDAAGTGVEWTDNVDIPGTLDVTGAATFDSSVTITGDLTVNGTTTNINTQNLVVEDKNVILGDVATPTDVTADGGGITLKGATDKTISWIDATDAWTLSEHVNIASGKEYRIDGVKVIDGNSLGSGVTSSSLTSLGTLSSLTSSGDVTLNAQSDLRFADADSSNWVAFQAPATIASNVTWTLPSADGTASQVLSTNGSGTLSWTTPASGAGLDTAQTWTKGQRGEITALTDGATITPDFSDSNHFSVTLGGNRTLANPTNLVAGQSGCIWITQPSSGGPYTLAYGSYWDFTGGTAPTLTTTANARDCLVYAVQSATQITAQLITNLS